MNDEPARGVISYQQGAAPRKDDCDGEMRMNVDRCVCHSMTFEELKAVARAGQLDFDALQARTGCCTGCRMCEPYVRRMLRTGETRIPLMGGDPGSLEDDEPGQGEAKR